jgi:hypothetical protein
VKKEHLSLLLEKAQDESASKKELQDIWFSSKSVKIRKAIASNPNSGTEVLKMAARLYLEEVLENPGFEMLKLFDSDPWITKISEAYEDPNVFFVKYGKYTSIGINGDLFTRAVLLSKKLTPEALNCCLCYGSRTALDRALKNKVVLSNIQALVRQTFTSEANAYFPYEIEGLLCLHKRDVINDQDLSIAVSKFGMASVSAKKRVYSDFFNKTIQKYAYEKDESKKSFFVKLFSRVLIVSRSHTLGWIDPYSPNINREVFIDFIARAFKIIVDTTMDKYLTSDHRRTLSNILCYYAREKFNRSKQEASDFKAIYDFFKSYGIVEAIIANRSGLNFRHEGWVKEIEKCPIEVKNFLVRCESLGSWVPVGESDGRCRIFNQVNDAIYEESGVSKRLLFRECSLRKIITISDSTYVY